MSPSCKDIYMTPDKHLHLSTVHVISDEYLHTLAVKTCPYDINFDECFHHPFVKSC